MNYAMIVYLLGWVLLCEGALLLPPAVVSALYQEPDVWAFLGCAALYMLAGFVITRFKPRNRMMYLREGFVITALSWIVISATGAVPFVATGAIPHYVDALFETVSGFTTTGASILPAVEDLSYGILFWRSFTHWVGGMGVLVFLLSLLPLTGGSHMNLMKAESPGPQVEKLVPKVQSTAAILYGIYFLLTVLEVVFLLAGHMPLFEALTTAFGTAGTGGFGIKNDSIAGYSVYIQVVVTVFMILFGINFNFYFFLLLRRFKRAFAMQEVRAYLLIIAASTLLIGINILPLYAGLGQALQQAAFQVGSIITTTGFASADFALWPAFSQTVLVILMFVGACAGSTGGGIKVARFLILGSAIRREFRHLLHPQSVNLITMEGKTVSAETARSTQVFILAYTAVFTVSLLLISLDCQDFTTNFTAIAATLNNIGPGLAGVGPTESFGFFSAGSKVVMIFDMLAGRLELFPLLLLFHRETWRRF